MRHASARASAVCLPCSAVIVRGQLGLVALDQRRRPRRRIGRALVRGERRHRAAPPPRRPRPRARASAGPAERHGADDLARPRRAHLVHRVILPPPACGRAPPGSRRPSRPAAPHSTSSTCVRRAARSSRAIGALAEAADVRREHHVRQRHERGRTGAARRRTRRAPPRAGGRPPSAWASASSSTRPPRDGVDEDRVAGASGRARSPPISPRVEPSSGTWSDTTSERRSSSSSATVSRRAPPDRRRGSSTSKPTSRRATARPMRAEADEPDGRAGAGPRA